MTMHRRPSKWADWMAAVCAGVSSGEHFSLRLTMEERDALAALCIEYGGLTRPAMISRLIMERAKTVDVQGNIAHFVHTGTAKAHGPVVPAPRSPWEKLPPPTPAPSAWHGQSPPLASASGYTAPAPASTPRVAPPAPEQAPARPAAQPPPLPGRRS
jgi:hypothetical protein